MEETENCVLFFYVHILLVSLLKLQMKRIFVFVFIQESCSFCSLYGETRLW
jgi:hypothetical protein